MNEPIQILVVDDHPLFRDGVVQTLRAEPDIQVVGEAMTAAVAVQLATELVPDMVLLDVGIPGSGVNAARAIAASLPAIKIIMVTASAAEEDVLSAFQAGAHGYILKGVSGRELIHIVRSVYAGEAYVTPSLAVTLLSELQDARRNRTPEATPLDELTDREREILEHVAAGESNREIAQHLYLSEKTVKNYMTNILQKLQVRNRVEAALLAQSGGLGKQAKPRLQTT